MLVVANIGVRHLQRTLRGWSKEHDVRELLSNEAEVDASGQASENDHQDKEAERCLILIQRIALK